jgi:hypothetical protein
MAGNPRRLMGMATVSKLKETAKKQANKTTTRRGTVWLLMGDFRCL